MGVGAVRASTLGLCCRSHIIYAENGGGVHSIDKVWNCYTCPFCAVDTGMLCRPMLES